MNPQIGLNWSYVLIALATILGAVGVLGSNYYGKKVDEYKQQISIKPVVDFKINSQKILTLENKGTVDIKDIRIFLTKYVFDENIFASNKLKIKEYNKVGGAVEMIPLLKAKIGFEKIDLTKLPLVTFYEGPGKEIGTSFLTYYCLRITFRKEATGQQYVYYAVTTAYKTYPSLIENQENTAVGGNVDIVSFMLGIPEFLKKHQVILFNDTATLTEF